MIWTESCQVDSRFKKIINGKIVKFIYDLNGNLIKEGHYKESRNLEYVLVFIYESVDHQY